MAQPSSVPKIRTDLAYYGLVTRVISATQFVAAGLAGLGDGALVNYAAYVMAKANGTITPPHAEQPAVSAYVSSSGTFTHAVYTAALAVGDHLLLLHPDISTTANAIKTQTDKLAGETPVSGSVSDNWQSGTGTSGETGEDLVTIGANDTKYKLHALLVNISALTVGATITVKLFMQVHGTERKVYSQAFTQGTDPDGLWIVNGTVGIHEALRVEIESNNAGDNGLAVDYDYMLEAM